MKTPPKTVYKICDKELWAEARKKGVFDGAEIDLSDGFIHLSTASQVASTLAKHFSGRENLVLAAIDAEAVGELVYEQARDGDLFPHLYKPLLLAHVIWTDMLQLDENENHILPDLGV